MTEVNIPLLRKAVEWAEAEAAKPAPLREWEQNFWYLPPEVRAERLEKRGDDFTEREREAYQKAPECGTCYCIAGYVASQLGHDFSTSGWEVEDVAAEALGLDLDQSDDLFDGRNTIEDVRRIAEEIAGERL
jgi:hypothetical protein